MSSSKLQLSAASMALAIGLAAPHAANAADAMRVVRDPQTGELRGPTAAEAEAFQKAEAQMRAAPTGKPPLKRTLAGKEIIHANGTVEMPLGEDSMMYSVATVSTDGVLRMDCLPAKQAQSLIKSSTNSLKKTSVTRAVTKADHEHQ